MRIDIVTIFPEFFSVLDVSLLGKARQNGVIELSVHDLRDSTHDRHRTVRSEEHTSELQSQR